MLERLVWKSPIQPTRQRVKWIPGACVLTISFQSLPRPMFTKQRDFNIVLFYFFFWNLGEANVSNIPGFDSFKLFGWASPALFFRHPCIRLNGCAQTCTCPRVMSPPAKRMYFRDRQMLRMLLSPDRIPGTTTISECHMIDCGTNLTFLEA